ncbi:MAG: rod shape-determining protein RodA [Desulfobacca sp.]|uniref:rod shape-determining protein RodA n=1 Tax=Desulfobacca sp. TaxID=2067990 RepID=UPI0040499C7A
MIDRRLLKNIDWLLILLVLAVVSLGIINLYSAGFNQTGDRATPLYVKQIYWLLIGLALMCAMTTFDYRRLANLAYPIYWFSILLLVAVMLVGKVVAGSKRWLVLGPITFQPSELAKVGVILALATHFFRREQFDPLTWRQLAFPSLLLLIPFGLVGKQPDLGSALLIATVAGTLILFVGVRWHILLTLGVSLISASPVFWYFLKDYQKQRIFTFLNPEQDPLGSGYHIIQSKIAVGSGLFWGKGFLKGTQSQLNFLPEQHTDFVFSVFAEEWGFVGSVVLIVLYLGLILWGLQIARACRERLGNLLAVGITAMIFWQIFINISMVTGLLPVVGIPLPFFSYGGSSLIVNFLGIGLLLNIRMRQFLFAKPTL